MNTRFSPPRGGKTLNILLKTILLSAVALALAPGQAAWGQSQEPTLRLGCGPGGAFEALASFGPLNEYGYPAYYADQNGVALDLCDETAAVDPLCANPPLDDPAAPPSIATENFWHETFYFLGTTNIQLGGFDALLVLAVEGVMDNATEAIIDGDQLVFSRIRHRVSVPNDPSSIGTYTITHPFGVDVYEVTAADLAETLGNRVINATDDCLHRVINGAITPTCGVAIGDQFTNIIDPTRSRISHYLTWDTGAPPGYVGDLAVPHVVVGSPCGTNFFRVEGPGVPGGSIETNLFNILGRLSTTTCGDGVLDPAAGEACDDGNTDDGDCCSSICQLEADGSACEDGDICSIGDTCSAGVCGAGPADPNCGCGDVSGELDVTIGDALMVAQHQVGLRTCEEMPTYEKCDIAPTGGTDGVCNIADALTMAQCTVGLISCDFTCTPLVCAPAP